jgi:Mg2+/Co2+ transporter CorB
VGVKINPNVNPTHVDELRGLIELHAGPGEEVAHERAMLRSILDLSNVEVDQIMTHRKNIAMIDAEEPIEKIIEHVLELPYSRIPLWQDNPENVIGVLRVKDLFRALRAMDGDLRRISLKAIAVKPWFIPESTTLLDQLQAFRERREHFALVVDEYGALRGIVTLEDILEEIVGEISDEHDIALQGVRTTADGSYIIAGTVTIRDLNRQFEWNLPAEEASTIAGLVLHEARMIPEVGQLFSIEGFQITVLRRHRQQITLLKVIPPRVGVGEDKLE